jgi:hypothetical protein
VPAGEIERWAAENDPIDRYVRRLTTELGFERPSRRRSTSACAARSTRHRDRRGVGFPEPLDALVGVYADPPAERPLWFREGVRASSRRTSARRVGHVAGEGRGEARDAAAAEDA